MPNIFSHPYQLDKPLFNFRVVGWYFSFLFKETSVRNSETPDQTPRFAASDLVSQRLSMSH